MKKHPSSVVLIQKHSHLKANLTEKKVTESLGFHSPNTEKSIEIIMNLAQLKGMETNKF